MNRDGAWGRRDLLKGSLAVGGLAGLQGCAPSVKSAATVPPRGVSLVPMRMSVDEIIDVKCCIRPFRPQGPRLDAEQIGDTLVIHNYGHGGSGWSLSWGSAEIVVGKAMTVLPKEIAVIGCGIIGLTAAVVAQRAGAKVTIYARDQLPRTRSFRANGSWTPDSRISLTEPAGAAFGDLWEQMARISWKNFRTYLGLPERPVEFSDQYGLSDGPIRSEGEGRVPDATARGSFATTGMPQQKGEFGHYSDRIRDIVPQSETVSAEENPFGVAHVRRTSMMHFNFGSYGHLLMSEFFQQGGRFEMRDFHSPADVATLREKVVINCPGYAGRDLWRDKTIIPVRGQTGWLVPQPEAKYGLYYAGVSVLSKSDGVMMMHTSSTLGDMEGVGNSLELPDRVPIEEGVKIIAPIFDRLRGARA
ncbi:FAD-dependent oxidoreductase [Sphingomonas sp. MMS24-J13]|uniref:FAD-dependent oxidoreductase n=1 Tax=Sphingomonas sp. MMS24-J13 TaxID=3238686 RepID=UPI00384F41A0